MDKLKRVMAMAGVILVAGIWIATFLTGVLGGSKELLTALLVLSVVVPVLMYAILLVARTVSGKSAIDVIDEAMNAEADWIITHHPLIFTSTSSIDYADNSGRYIERLIRAGISVYSSHTAFDKTDGGNNDYLGQIQKNQDTATRTLSALKSNRSFYKVYGYKNGSAQTSEDGDWFNLTFELVLSD